MNDILKIKPKDIINKSVHEIEQILSEEAIRLGFSKGTTLTYPSKSSGLLRSVKLNGKFRLANTNGRRLDFHALVYPGNNNNPHWGISLFKEELFSFHGDEYLSDIPWILYDTDPGKNMEQTKHSFFDWITKFSM